MTVSIELQMEQMGQRAKKAARVLSAAAPAAKTQALRALAALLIERQPDILKANALDVDAAKAANMDAPRLDRLTLTPRIMADMADACLHVAEMADEVGVIEQQWQRPNGLMIGKMRIPLGVIAMIFESRPNVTIDAAILCLKAGDAVILRGGSEAIHSNLALAGLLHEALRSAGLPEDAAQVVETTDRAAVAALCKLDKYVDVMIPRGGESLVRAVCEAATMPVLKHYMGVCHLYIDKGADLGMALRLAHNGKVQRPGVCNALECLLVHEKEAASFLPMLAGKLGADGVEFSSLAKQRIKELQARPDAEELGICMVKTQYSLSDNPALKGAPTGWRLHVRDCLFYGGAGLVVPVAGDISLMPGTGSRPAFRNVDVDLESGQVTGLF